MVKREICDTSVLGEDVELASASLNMATVNEGINFKNLDFAVST